MRAFRIADGRRPVFDGQGAAMRGGRWNSPGRRVIYASETYAGALLEILVHTNIGKLPRHFVSIEIDIPDDVSREEVELTRLPAWDGEDLRASRAYGDEWYDRLRSAVLIVPSVVTRHERNMMINPRHADFARITATEPEPVIWDERLFRR
jgi:RES domain-containing protein